MATNRNLSPLSQASIASILVHTLVVFGIWITQLQFSGGIKKELFVEIQGVKGSPQPKTKSTTPKKKSNSSSIASPHQSRKSEPPASAAPSNSALGTSPNAGVQGDALPGATEEYLVTQMPRLLSEVQIPYPPGAKERGVTGAVVLDLLIDEKGVVRQVTLVSGPDEELNRVAIEAIKRFRFAPAEIEKKPVAVKIRYAYRFVLGQ